MAARKFAEKAIRKPHKMRSGDEALSEERK